MYKPYCVKHFSLAAIALATSLSFDEWLMKTCALMTAPSRLQFRSIRHHHKKEPNVGQSRRLRKSARPDGGVVDFGGARLGEPIGIDRGWIEFIFVDPTREFAMTLVLGIVHCFEELGIAPRASSPRSSSGPRSPDAMNATAAG